MQRSQFSLSLSLSFNSSIFTAEYTVISLQITKRDPVGSSGRYWFHSHFRELLVGTLTPRFWQWNSALISPFFFFSTPLSAFAGRDYVNERKASATRHRRATAFARIYLHDRCQSMPYEIGGPSYRTSPPPHARNLNNLSHRLQIGAGGLLRHRNDLHNGAVFVRLAIARETRAAARRYISSLSAISSP